jgi:hypothetical protein
MKRPVSSEAVKINPHIRMKKVFLLLLLTASVTARALPTYEPFTEFAGAATATGTNAINLATGGFNAPGGELWSALYFSGTVGTHLVGLDIDVTNMTAASPFPAASLSSLLPNTFPGVTGGDITTVVVNAEQPFSYPSPNYVGNSAVLNFSHPITRPSSGTKTVYISYLFNLAQAGQLGTGNNGRYLALLSSTNLSEGWRGNAPVAGATYTNWAALFNTYNGSTATGVHYASHGLLSRSGGYYVGACDSTTGKNWSTTALTGTYATPVFIVGAYVLNSGAASDTNIVWMNPATSTLGGPTPPSTSVHALTMGFNMSDLGGLAFIDRAGSGAAGGVGTNYIANLLVGSTWSYVTGGPEFTNQPAASSSVNIGQNVSVTGNAVAAAQSVTYQWQKITGGVTNNVTNGAGGAGGAATVSGATTPTLTLTSVSSGDVGAFQLLATASGTSYSLASSTANIVLSDPQIVSSPTNTTANYSGTATFTAQFSTANAPLNYQWYKDSTPLANGVQPDGSSVSGANGTTGAGGSFTLTLTLGGVSYQDAGSYTLYATNTLNLAGFSTPATLTVNDPYIVTQPANPSTASGGNATFTVSAAGSPTLSYQWFEGATPLTDGATTATGSAIVSGSQTATLTLTGVTDPDNGKYSCAITSSASGQTANTAAATLTVQDPLTVVTTPQSRTERVGDHLAFVVRTTGGGPSFQWQFNGNPIAGATTSALILTNIQPANGGTYSVTVQNAATAPQTFSPVLTVVNSAILPLSSTNILVSRVGDSAQTLSGATGNTLYLDQYAPDGTYISTVQIPDEPAGAPYKTGGNASVYGSPALIVQGAGSDAVNGAMLTVSGGNNQFLGVAGYCESYPFSGADVTVGATAGPNWRGYATINAFGVYSLAYTNTGLYSIGNHTIRSVVTLDGTNFWSTGQAGANGLKFINSTVSSYAMGNGIPGVASTGAGTHVAGIFSGNLLFSDTGGIYACAGTPEPLAFNNATASLLISEAGLPVDFAVSPDQNTIYLTDGQAYSGATVQGGGIQRWDTNAATGVYEFSYTLPADPALTLGASGLAVDFSASPTWGLGVTGAKLFATTYGASSNSLVSVIDNGTNSLPNVIVSVGANNALRGVRFGPAAVPPAIVTAPQSQTNFPGNSVTFSVLANGSAPLSYQWFGPAGAITGATNSSFTTNGISFASAGNYHVVVSNPTGTPATSPNAVLTVTAGAPTITPGALANYTETAGDHLAWAPNINGSVPLTYSWFKSGNPTPVLTGTINTLAPGAGGLSLANIQTANSGTYTLVVTNIFGSASSSGGGVLNVTTSRQSLSPNNLVVSRIGDSAQTLSAATGNTLYLDQYTPSGAYVNSIQIPDEGTGQTYGTGGGSSTSMPFGSGALLFAGAGPDSGYEGFIALSPNGQNLTFAGYCEAYPFSGPDVSVGANGGVNWRGIANVDAYGYYTLSWTNTGLYSGGLHQVHSAVDLDGNGTNFFATGQAGGGNAVKYANVNNQLASGGAIVSVGGSFSGVRVAQIIGGNLVFSDVGTVPPGIYGFSGLPTSASTASLLIAETNSPVDFTVSPDATTVYITDDGTFTGSATQNGGIQRWDGTAPNNYTYSYTLPTGAGSTVGARGVTANFSANTTWGAGVNGAILYVTTAEPSGNRLIKVVDNGPSSAATTLVTASPGQILSSVRFGPTVIAPDFAVQPQSTNATSGSAASFSARASGSGPFTYQWYFQAGGSGPFTAISGATNSTYNIAHVSGGNVGNYYVIITSPSLATVQSQTVALILAQPPQFTAETNLGPGQGFQLSFTGTAGQNYSIYTTTDPSQTPVTSTWTLLGTGTFSGGTDTFTDPNGGASPQQFYIITVP